MGIQFLAGRLDEDDEVNLVGLVRSAPPRAEVQSFLVRPGDRTNPLYRRFGNSRTSRPGL